MAALSAPVNIPLASLKAKSTLASDERLINSYVEVIGQGQDVHAVVYVCAGLTALTTTLNAACRGMLRVDNDLYSVNGTQVFKTNSAGVSTFIGTIPGSDYVFIARNANLTVQIAFVAGGFAYVVQGGVLTIWPDLDLPQGNVKGVIWLDGYFIFAIGDGRFFWTGINTTTVDALDFATAEANPDGLVGIARLRQEIYLFGSQTIEVWVDTGAASQPFERLPGAVVQSGCSSAASVAEVLSRLYWLDQEGVVQRLTDGYQAEPVTTRLVYDNVQAVSDKTTIRGFNYTLNEHNFYVLWHDTFTNTYDASIDRWHERYSKFTLGGWRCNAHEYFNGRNVFGSSLEGTIWYHDEASYSEGADEIIAQMRFPKVDTFPQGGTVAMFEANLDTGTGIATASEPDTITPHLILHWSDDGAKTWKGGRIVPLGVQGEWTTRVRTTMLGSFGSKGRVWQITMSSKVFRSLLSAQMRASPMNNNPG